MLVENNVFKKKVHQKGGGDVIYLLCLMTKC